MARLIGCVVPAAGVGARFKTVGTGSPAQGVCLLPIRRGECRKSPAVRSGLRMAGLAHAGPGLRRKRRSRLGPDASRPVTRVGRSDIHAAVGVYRVLPPSLTHADVGLGSQATASTKSRAVSGSGERPCRRVSRPACTAPAGFTQKPYPAGADDGPSAGRGGGAVTRMPDGIGGRAGRKAGNVSSLDVCASRRHAGRAAQVRARLVGPYESNQRSGRSCERGPVTAPVARFPARSGSQEG